MNKFKFIAEEKIITPIQKAVAGVIKKQKKEKESLHLFEHLERVSVTCSRCGQTNETVRMRTDPYQSEINNDETERLLCDLCVGDLARDI